MLSQVAMKQVRPNPYRRMEAYPIIEAKVEALIESIEATDWWENIVGRPAGKTIEIAYGHHRIEALKRLGYTHFNMLVHDMDDDAMAKMMVRENDDVYSPTADNDREAMDSILEGAAAGKLHLPETEDSHNSTRQGGVRVSCDTRTSLRALAEYTNWSLRRVQGAIAQREAISAGVLDAEDFSGMNTEQARRVAKRVTTAVKDKPKEKVRKVAKKVAEEVRGGHTATRNIGSSVTRELDKQAKKVPDVNKFAWAMMSELNKIAGEDTKQEQQLLQLVQYRGYLQRAERQSLEKALDRAIFRLQSIRDELVKPVKEVV